MEKKLGKRATAGIMLTMLLIGTLTLASNIILGSAEEWVSYTPLPHQVDLIFWMEKQTAYIKVCTTFADAGYNVSNWGDVIKEDHEIWADSKIWDWTGPAILVITKICHTYNLGQLEGGTYTFTFKAWGLSVESITFIVPRLGDVNGDGYVSGLDIGIIGISLFTILGDPLWNPNCDLNGDGYVGGIDVGIAGIHLFEGS